MDEGARPPLRLLADVLLVAKRPSPCLCHDWMLFPALQHKHKGRLASGLPQASVAPHPAATAEPHHHHHQAAELT